MLLASPVLLLLKGVRVGADDVSLHVCTKRMSECEWVGVRECLCIQAGVSLVKTNHCGRRLRRRLRRGENTVNTKFQPIQKKCKHNRSDWSRLSVPD